MIFQITDKKVITLATLVESTGFNEPLFRLDVMNLQEQLDLKLQQRQARETGICQVSSGLSLSHSPLSSPGQTRAVRSVL